MKDEHTKKIKEVKDWIHFTRNSDCVAFARVLMKGLLEIIKEIQGEEVKVIFKGNGLQEE